MKVVWPAPYFYFGRLYRRRVDYQIKGLVIRAGSILAS
jgi:hypothetical protein